VPEKEGENFKSGGRFNNNRRVLNENISKRKHLEVLKNEANEKMMICCYFCQKLFYFSVFFVIFLVFSLLTHVVGFLV